MTPWIRSLLPRIRPLPRIVLLAVVIATAPAMAGTYEEEPINYEKTPATDAIARLQRQIDAGSVKLDRNDQRGYLDAVLKQLNIPASSQTLVFSKTSFQRELISPKNPRALYFNDD